MKPNSEKVIHPCGQANAVSPDVGNKDVIYPALAPEIERKTGLYFIEDREAQSSAESNDLDPARHLWELSKMLVKEKFL
ncbi:MAG: hypothetical protein GYA34_16725 [Chloroflexi bacterium]|nr:hypothetical protein [Chloroflexota bacterium]